MPNPGGFQEPKPDVIYTETLYSDDPPKRYEDGKIIFTTDKPWRAYWDNTGVIKWTKKYYEDGSTVAESEQGAKIPLPYDDDLRVEWGKKISRAKSEYDIAAREGPDKLPTQHYFQGAKGEEFVTDPVTGETRKIYDPSLTPMTAEEKAKYEADIEYKKAQTEYQRRLAGNVGAPPQRAPRYPEEIELSQLDIEKTRLDIEKARQQMLGPYAQAMQQRTTALQLIEDRLGRGEMTFDEANNMVDLINKNTEALMRGTTPWEIEQAKQKEEQVARQERQRALEQQQNLALETLQGQTTTGSNLAQGLLSGAGSIYGKILGGTKPPLDFNPLLMASGFVNNQMGNLGQLAQGILSNAFQQQPAPVTQPGQDQSGSITIDGQQWPIIPAQ